MKLIPLTQGKFAKVDDADFDWLNQWKWQAVSHRRTYYAIRTIAARPNDFIEKQTIKMHRLILEVSNGELVDHEDHDGLNNQRDNLRLATTRQNSQNRLINHNNQTGYKGVDFEQRRNKFRAVIRVEGKLIWLGRFILPEQAALAYDEAAEKFFGEFAMTNKKLGLLETKK